MEKKRCPYCGDEVDQEGQLCEDCEIMLKDEE